MAFHHRTDVAIVGAGTMGLVHALEARARGLEAVVVSADPPGEAVRGETRLGWASALLAGDAMSDVFDESARAWDKLARQLGFWASHSGSLLLARSAGECSVLEEMTDRHPHLEARDLSGAEVTAATGFRIPRLRRAMHLPADVVVDLRAASTAIACHLDDDRVPFVWGTEIEAVEAGSDGHSRVRLTTTGGWIDAAALVVCDPDAVPLSVVDGHDVTITGPLRYGVALRTPVARTAPAIVSGSSMLNLPALATTDASDALFEEFVLDHTDVMRAGVSLTLWPTPSGSLCGGTIRSANGDRLDLRAVGTLLDEASRVLGIPVSATHIWTLAGLDGPGVAVAAPTPQIRVVTVSPVLQAAASFGLARRVLDDVCGIRLETAVGATDPGEPGAAPALARPWRLS